MTVTATTITRYASPAEFAIHGLTTGALSSVVEADLEEALDAASDEASGYLAEKFTLPLLGWPKVLVRKVCDLGVWYLMSVKGYAAGENANAIIAKRYDDAVKWFKSLSTESPGFEDSSDEDAESRMTVASDELQGWDDLL